jgi:hypothetical protein
MFWAELCPSPNSYIEPLTPNIPDTPEWKRVFKQTIDLIQDDWCPHQKRKLEPGVR